MRGSHGMSGALEGGRRGAGGLGFDHDRDGRDSGGGRDVQL